VALIFLVILLVLFFYSPFDDRGMEEHRVPDLDHSFGSTSSSDSDVTPPKHWISTLFWGTQKQKDDEHDVSIFLVLYFFLKEESDRLISGKFFVFRHQSTKEKPSSVFFLLPSFLYSDE